FSYEGINHQERLLKPEIKKDGKWQQVEWADALKFAADSIKNFLNTHTPAQLGALASPSSTVEEYYLLQKLLRENGCANLDHRLKQGSFKDQEFAGTVPFLGCSIEQLEQMEAGLVVG